MLPASFSVFRQNGGHRRAQREADYVSAGAFPRNGMGSMGTEDSEDPESEEGVESGAEVSRKAAKRLEKRKAKDASSSSLSRKESRKTPAELAYPEDLDAEGEPDFMDIDSLSLADLDSPAGRLVRVLNLLFAVCSCCVSVLTV